MEKDLIRLLRAEEIECRIAMVNEKGLSLLLYKDARVDQRILDETFGAFGWKRSHQCIDGNLYCTVEILDRESGEWISKQDVGTTGYTEKEKSQASDSFKRACFNWGIGRELYSAPFIWIPAAKTSIQKKGDKYISNERFSVSAISFNDNREIVSLEITDSHGQTVYVLRQGGSAHQDGGRQKMEPKDGKAGQGKRQGKSSNQEQAQTGRQDPEPMDGQKDKQNPDSRNGGNGKCGISGPQEIVLMAELNRTGVALEDVLKRYGIGDISQMTPEIYNRSIAALKQTKPKARTPGTAA
jgi:hypothetical protein|nr:hypothetical protein [uncultured Acetatifactor sp.]